ncbi:MAG: outer membrane beta-barrel protein [Bacteroidota bacterium]
MKFDQEQQLDYADLPLLVKYEFTQNKLRPYVQIGAYYSVLINATKSVTVSGTDNASGARIHSRMNRRLLVQKICLPTTGIDRRRWI